MPRGEHLTLPTGPWNNAELEASALAVVPPGSDMDIPETDRFKAGVTKLIGLRTLRDAAESGLAVFLLSRLSSTPSQEWQRTPMLDNGLTSLGSKIWIVNAPVVAGFSCLCEDLTDDNTFRLVTDTYHLGSVPAMVYDARMQPPELRFYGSGLGAPEAYEVISLLIGSLPLERILQEVESIYRQHFITPEAQSEPGKLWKKASHWWPQKNAEKTVQFYLKIGLSRAFPNCVIREEQTQVTGRIDLEIEERVAVEPSLFRRHAILELKVLRSRGETGTSYAESETLEWVKKGVEQAHAYRQERSALASALCCFDLRESDTANLCFSHVGVLASSLGVTLRRWYVYASSELFRAALAQAAS